MSDQIDGTEDQVSDLAVHPQPRENDAEVRLLDLINRLEQIPYNPYNLSVEELIFVIDQITPCLCLEQLGSLCKLVHHNNIVNRYF